MLKKNKKASYGEKYRPDQQKHIDEIPIDPVLRPGFFCTLYSQRSALEKEDWWLRPFVVSATWEQREPGVIAQLITEQKNNRNSSSPPDKVPMVELKARKTRWYAAFPKGIQYTVFCLDTECGYSPTIRGITASLDAAINVAKHPTPPSRITQFEYDCFEIVLKHSRLLASGYFDTAHTQQAKAQYPHFS